MKNFRTLAQTKKDIETLQKQINQNKRYISLVENYKPKTFTQHVIHEYACEGNLVRTAENLNKLGHTIDGRTIESQDISTIIQSKPDHDDFLHKEVRRLYLKKIRSRWWVSPNKITHIKHQAPSVR